MSDLIERGDARSIVICAPTYQMLVRGEWITFVKKKDIINAINSIPSADRPRGEWIHDGSVWTYRFNCANCGYHLLGKQTNYCPNCGSRMKGADDETR